MRWVKALGLAGVLGVATTGVVVARAERRRRAYTPDEVRGRLRTRYAEVSATTAGGEPLAGAGVADHSDQFDRPHGRHGAGRNTPRLVTRLAKRWRRQ